ncbi:MAG: response regulator [Opitutales bacterium]
MAAAQPAEENENAHPKLYALIAEDNPVNRRVLEIMMKRMGHAYEVVENGLEALEKLKAKAFEVVLMDVHMPAMDGLEATRRIREGYCGDDKKDIYIAAVTALAMSGDREKCLESGMNAYLPKPVKFTELERIFVEEIYPSCSSEGSG